MESLKRCESIEDQARLVDQTQSIEAAGLPSSSTRDGPPDVLDLALAEGKQEVHARTKARVTEALEKLDLGLNWDDVEDVIPFPDAGVTFVHRLRNVSWNLRFVYSAPCDSQQLEAAVKRSLENHPTLRSMTIEFDGKVFIVPIRTSKKWWNASLTTGHELDTPDGLRTLLLDDPVLDAAAAPGPLTRMHIASIRDGTSGIVLVASHSVNDQSSMRLWMEDIAIGIKSLSAPLPPRVAFRDFAGLYYQHRQGAEAKHGVQYWARKLHGISSLPDTTFWPNQRAPEFMKGIDPEWRHWNGSLSRTGERSVSFVEKRKAQKGLRRMAKIQDISRLKSVHNIPSLMLVKAAMAMMNVKFTGGKEAVWGTFNAARSWPFKSDYADDIPSGNPLDISGATIAVVCDRIAVPRSKTILNFLKQVNDDEVKNTEYAHAPFYQVIDALCDPIDEDDTRSYLERQRDAEAILPATRRQVFNWLPPAMPPSPGYQGLQMLEMLPRMDNGATLSGFLGPDRKHLALGFMWDAEHLSYREAEEAIDLVVRLVEAMGKEENWSLTVGDILRM